LLVYVAPSASIALGTASYYLEVQVTRFFQRRLVERLRKTLSAYLESPYTSEEHKGELRRQLETVEQVITLQQVEYIRVIGSLPQMPDRSQVSQDATPPGTAVAQEQEP
jgi:hypothetical protein